jgi:hypothetical protein
MANIIRGLVQHDPEGPTTVEDIDILNTNEWGEQYAVTENGVCVMRYPPYEHIFTPESEKRNQPFLIDPRTV